MNFKFMSMVVAAMLLSACGGQGEDLDDTDVQIPLTELEIAEETSPELNDDELVRVCRAGHGFSVGREPNDMSATLKPDRLVRLSYTRDDGKSFRYDCMVEGNVIRTRMIDEAGPGTGPGAWSGRASRSTFEVDGNSLTIREVFFDGSSDEETFSF